MVQNVHDGWGPISAKNLILTLTLHQQLFCSEFLLIFTDRARTFAPFDRDSARSFLPLIDLAKCAKTSRNSATCLSATVTCLDCLKSADSKTVTSLLPRLKESITVYYYQGSISSSDAYLSRLNEQCLLILKLLQIVIDASNQAVFVWEHL